jgi:SagB-type dehydrogenase family enzyme
MEKIIVLTTTFILMSFMLSCYAAAEQDKIKLPEPKLDSGKLLMQALKERKSTRTFSEKELPDQVLGNLLWAAFGVNRPESDGRTAPSPMGVKEMSVYVAMKQGLYLYNPQDHSLELIVGEDLRADTGKQPFVGTAPLNLVYVADYSKLDKFGTEKDFYAGVDTGTICQNVYLCCASEGLATVVRGSVDKETLWKKMKLGANQKIILAQTIGYPEDVK